MSLICRTCSQAKSKFVNLFNHYDNNNLASEMLNECTSVKVQKGDRLPSHICIECLETLISAWHFRRMTIETDMKLHKIFRKRTPNNKSQYQSNNITIVKEEVIIKNEVCNPPTIENQCDRVSDESYQINQDNANSFIQADESSLSNFIVSACNDKENFLPEACTSQYIDLSNQNCNIQQLQYTEKSSDVQQLQHVVENTTIDHNYASNYHNISSSIMNGQKLITSLLEYEPENVDNISNNAICENSILPIKEQSKRNYEYREISPCNANDNISLTRNIEEPTVTSQSSDIPHDLHEKRTPQKSYFVFQSIKDDVQQGTREQQIISRKDDNMNSDKASNKPNKLLVLGEYRKLTSEEKDKISIRCRLCKKIFKYRYYYQVHVRHHRGDLPHKCNLCGKRFPKPSLLKSHATTHSEARPFTCDRCGKTFKQANALQKHKSVHFESRPYKCNACGLHFKLESALKTHMRRHENQRDQICETCGKTYVERSDLRNHLKSHSDVKDYLCTECGKAFNTASKLRNHFKHNHSNEKPHICDYCGRRFKDKCVLKNHSLIHTGERPHSCTLCKKTFRQAVALRTHMRTHTGEAPYACKVCPSQFKYSQLLTNHMKNHK